MKTSLAAILAFRYWITGQGSGLTRWLRFLSLFNIALGMAITLLGIALIQGFDQALRERMLRLIPHVQVTGFTDLADAEIVHQLKKVAGVNLVLPHSLVPTVLSSSRKSKLLALTVLPSLSMHADYHIYPFLPKLPELDGPVCVVGKGLAQHLDVQVGDWLSCSYSTVRNGKQVRTSPLRRTSLRIVAIVNLEGEFDTQLALTTQNVLSRYFQDAQMSCGYYLYAEQPFALRKMVDEIRALSLPDRVHTSTWEVQYGYMFQDLASVTLLLRVVVAIITGMAAANIFYLLVSVIKAWRRDASILLGLGAKPRFIWHWLHWYASFNWLAGIGGGTFLGLGLIRYKTNIFNLLEQWIGGPLLSREVYFIEQLPLILGWKEVIWAWLGAQCIAELALLASLFHLKSTAPAGWSKVQT